MVDIVSRRCQDPSCMRRPLYNYIGLRSMFCSKHKLPGMIDVVSARCEEPVRSPGSLLCFVAGSRRCGQWSLAFTRAARACEISRARLLNAESPSCTYCLISKAKTVTTRT